MNSMRQILKEARDSHLNCVKDVEADTDTRCDTCRRIDSVFAVVRAKERRCNTHGTIDCIECRAIGVE